MKIYRTKRKIGIDHEGKYYLSMFTDWYACVNRPQLFNKLYNELKKMGFEVTFPHGTYLMTGTGIVPPDSFTLQAGDVIKISITNIGTLENTVA